MKIVENDTPGVCKGNILIIDDTLENVKFLVKILESEGYTVRPSLSGQLGLRAAQMETPDLILLDIMMPEMNGFEVADRLQKNDVLRDVPVIFISALDDMQNKLKSFSAGGVDYITKPFQVEELLARVTTHLTLQRLRKALKDRNEHLERANEQLQSALDEIETLQGIIPICAECKKIRNDAGYWEQLESYIQKHSGAKFSHGICPECSEKLYGNEPWYQKTKNKDEKGK